MIHRSSILPLTAAFIVAAAMHLALLPLSFGSLGQREAAQPAADVQIANLRAPAIAKAGERIEVNITVRNLGDAAAAARQDRLLLSRDRTIGDDDLVLDRIKRNSLSAGSEESYDVEAVLPANADGPYVLIAEAPAPGDANPRNNTRSTSIFIDGPQRPELALDELNAPPRGIIGSTVLVDFSVTNRGPGWTAMQWSDRVYLSTDTTLDHRDHPLRTLARYRPLGPGKSYRYDRIELDVPAVPPGTYFLIAVADHAQVLDQPSFTAGRALAEIEISFSDMPDLVVTNIEAPPRIAPGQATPLRFTVANHGPEPTPAGQTWEDHVYLSRDRTITSKDIYLGSSKSLKPLDAGQRYTQDAYRLVLPDDTEPGQWYLAVVADGGRAVDEGAFESNNAWAVPITVLSKDEAKQQPPLGKPDEVDRLTVAWIEHESLIEHMAIRRSTIQPAIQSRAEPVPDAPSNPDPLPPSEAGVARAASGDPDAARPQTDPQQQSSPRPEPSATDASESDLVPRPQDPNRPTPQRLDGVDGRDGQLPIQRDGIDTPQPPTDQTQPSQTPDEQDTSAQNPGEREVESDTIPDAPETDRQTDSPTPAETDRETDRNNPDDTDSTLPTETTEQTESDVVTENDTTEPSKSDGQGDSEEDMDESETTDAPDEQDSERPPGESTDPSKPSPEQTPTRREREDAEADETDINEPLRYQEGGVLVGRGIRVKTRRLRAPGAGTRFTTVPRDARIKIVFNNKGEVVDAEMLSSTGYRDWDALILESLYRWTAEGERIDAAEPHVIITMPYKFGLLSGQ